MTGWCQVLVLGQSREYVEPKCDQVADTDSLLGS